MSFLSKLAEEVLPIEYLTEVSDFENPSKGNIYTLSASSGAQNAVARFLSRYGVDLKGIAPFIFVRRAKKEDFSDNLDFPILGTAPKKERHSVMRASSGYEFLSHEKYFNYVRGAQKTGNAHEFYVAAFIKFPNESEFDPKNKSTNYLKDVVKRVGMYEFFKNKEKETEKLISAIRDTKKSIIEDARRAAERFHENTLDAYNVDKIQWYGAESATSDSSGSKSNVADLIVYSKKGDEFNVSLKYGEGQMKNLTAKTTLKIITEQYDEIIDEIEENKQFMEELLNIDSIKIDNLVVSIINFVLDNPENIIASMDEMLVEKLRMVSGWDDWNRMGGQDKKKFSLNIGEKATGEVKEEWRRLREIYLFPVLKQFMEKELNNEEEIQRDKLIKLYKKIFSIEKKEYIYISSAKYIQMPSEERFEEIIDAFEFSHNLQWSGSNPVLILNVALSGKSKDILSVDLNFRWTNGQLVGDLGAKASAVKFIGLSDREVSDILNGNFN